jgi:hypothetical protein
MKMTTKTFVLFFIAALFTLMLIMGACSKSDPSQEDVFLKKLNAKTWKVSAVSLDGKDVTSLFPGFQLTITTSKTYSSTNAVIPIWKANGSFSLTGTAPNFHLLRDDGIDVTVVQADTKLVLEFQYDKALAGGRIGAVSGGYHFEFN